MPATPARNHAPANDDPSSGSPRVAPARGSGQFLGSRDLAALCKVDLKTIHNWVNRGVLAHFRTPGRHLRFRPRDVAQFLRGCGFAVPRELAAAEPRPLVVVGSVKMLSLTTAALGDDDCAPRRLDPYDALILAGAAPAGVYVVEADGLPPPMKLREVVEALGRASPRSTLIVVGSDQARLPASAVCVERTARALRAALLVDAERAEAAPLDER